MQIYNSCHRISERTKPLKVSREIFSEYSKLVLFTSEIFCIVNLLSWPDFCFSTKKQFQRNWSSGGGQEQITCKENFSSHLAQMYNCWSIYRDSECPSIVQKS